MSEKENQKQKKKKNKKHEVGTQEAGAAAKLYRGRSATAQQKRRL